MTPPILCYHKVDTRLELGATRLAPRVFRRQMEALARAGVRTLGAAELERELSLAPAEGPDAVGTAPGDGAALVLTFDDAYAGLARHVFPVLADLGLRALVFVITDYAGRDNSWDVGFGLRFRHLDWDELARWQASGVVEVHAHGATHARLTWLTDDAVRDELGRSREAIAGRLGTAPSAFCYPYGATDRRVVGLVREAGYRLGFAGPRGGQSIGLGDRAFALPRLPVYAWDAGAVPFVLRSGAPGTAFRTAARLAGRLSVLSAGVSRLSRRGGGTS